MHTKNIGSVSRLLLVCRPPAAVAAGRSDSLGAQGQQALGAGRRPQRAHGPRRRDLRRDERAGAGGRRRSSPPCRQQRRDRGGQDRGTCDERRGRCSARRARAAEDGPQRGVLLEEIIHVGVLVLQPTTRGVARQLWPAADGVRVDLAGRGGCRGLGVVLDRPADAVPGLAGRRCGVVPRCPRLAPALVLLLLLLVVALLLVLLLALLAPVALLLALLVPVVLVVPLVAALLPVVLLVTRDALLGVFLRLLLLLRGQLLRQLLLDLLLHRQWRRGRRRFVDDGALVPHLQARDCEIIHGDLLATLLRGVLDARALHVVASAVHPDHVVGGPIADDGGHARLERLRHLLHALILVQGQLHGARLHRLL